MVRLGLASTLLPTLLLAINFVDADKVAITRRVNLEQLSRIVSVDQNRAARFIDGSRFARRNGSLESRVQSIAMTNQIVYYEAVVGIGSPATEYTLLVDTGSANTWIGAGKSYTRTSTSRDTGNTVSVSYGSGDFKGKEYIDRVTLSNNLIIDNQSIGVASSSTGVRNIDGLLGIGPVELTEGTVSNTQQVPTVTYNLFTEGTIEANVIGIAFAPPNSYLAQVSVPGVDGVLGDGSRGSLSFGGPEEGKYVGEITYTPITATSPANQYVGIDASLSYGSDPILSLTAGIVDSGTTLTLLATDAFNAYKDKTGAELDQATGLLKVTRDQFANLQDFVVDMAGRSFRLIPDAQRFPAEYNTQLGGVEDAIYLVFADLEADSGQGMDFVLGMTFLERFYHVYDVGNQQVGLAENLYTNRVLNSPQRRSLARGPFPRRISRH